MRKRKGLKEVVPGYENVSFYFSHWSILQSLTFFFSTTTSCKNGHGQPELRLCQSFVETFMRMMNSIQFLQFNKILPHRSSLLASTVASRRLALSWRLSGAQLLRLALFASGLYFALFLC
jgi:hypothetical protein